MGGLKAFAASKLPPAGSGSRFQARSDAGYRDSAQPPLLIARGTDAISAARRRRRHRTATAAEGHLPWSVASGAENAACPGTIRDGSGAVWCFLDHVNFFLLLWNNTIRVMLVDARHGTG
jgi:hypothetical protein